MGHTTARARSRSVPPARPVPRASSSACVERETSSRDPRRRVDRRRLRQRRVTGREPPGGKQADEMSDQAVLLLRKQLKELSRNPIEGFSAGLVDDSNVFEWQITVMGPPDTMYEGGLFTANMSFPTDYPNKPPSVNFVSDMWHPNVYADGRVRISILHSPGDDPMGYEQASERWSPVQTVETIMLSIISMLSSPNDESPANIDAAKQFRDDPAGFRKRVAQCVRRSQEM